MNTPQQHPLMTPAEVARTWNVDVKTVTRWAQNGQLPEGAAWVMTPGGHRRYRRAYIEQMLKQGGQS